MTKNILLLFIIIIAAITAMTASCTDDEEFTSGSDMRLEFSCDTLRFDTVFTTIPSATHRFKIYNRNDRGLYLPSVRLASGGQSGFRLNLDGQTGTSFTDVSINHDDSLFCFVEVTVPAHNSDTPLLLSDSIQFIHTDGTIQQVVLEAYGQDIIMLRDCHITDSLTLSGIRPYVIYDSLSINPGATLTLTPGTTLCFHSGASLAVRGTLIAQGTTDQPVTFRGDRTDHLFTYLPYDRTDSQWGGITFYAESHGNRLVNCDIHGGSYGVRGISQDSLYILNTAIHNVAGDALCLTDSRAVIHGVQLSNAGGNCATVIGGTIDFTHCTLAQFYPWASSHGSALYFANVADGEVHPLHQLQFVNSIITGYSHDEVYADRMPDSDAPFNYQFSGSLVNTVLTDADQPYFTQCLLDTIGDTSYRRLTEKELEAPRPMPREGNFHLLDLDNYIYDFALDSLSLAIGLGIDNVPADCQTDMRGTRRPNRHPDAGCYQKK